MRVRRSGFECEETRNVADFILDVVQGKQKPARAGKAEAGPFDSAAAFESSPIAAKALENLDELVARESAQEAAGAAPVADVYATGFLPQVSPEDV
eukprot:tig00000361_g24412.t1